MSKRKVLPADYVARRALYLPEKARYDRIMQQAATSGADLPRLVTDAMTAIETEFQPLLGVLPKDYGILETNVLEDLMRLFNSKRIRQATGDVFGIPGPLEQALVGTPVAEGEAPPLAVQHVVRSFDPCMVCTVH